MTHPEAESIRREILVLAKPLRIAIPSTTPLLPEGLALRDSATVCARILAVNALLYVAWGNDKTKVASWLEREGLDAALTSAELRFVLSKQGYFWRFTPLIEGLWALAWAGNVVERLDFGKDFAKDFAELLPKVLQDESGAAFREKVQLRDLDSILRAYDLSICLNWGMHVAEQQGRKPPSKTKAMRIVERRKALEWLLGDMPWDDIQTDLP